MIPKGPRIDYRGRTTECGTCGCQSNLWASNSQNLEGKLICPGNAKYPADHYNLMKCIDYVSDENMSDRDRENVALNILRIKAKFKSVAPDVVIDGSLST